MEGKIRKVREAVKENFVETPAHTLGHLERVAQGAAWFVEVESGSEKDKQLAYIAGLLHDFSRPSTEKIQHSEESATQAEIILREEGIDEKDIARVLPAVRDHGGSSQWEDALHSSVYLADKILEQMGAYAVFRRCLYVGDCEDFADTPFKDAVLSYFKKRLGRLDLKNFPQKYVPLARHRNSLPLEFFNALKAGEDWAWELAGYAYDSGRKKTKVEESVKKFNPESRRSKEFKNQARRYLESKDLSSLKNFLGGKNE